MRASTFREERRAERTRRLLIRGLVIALSGWIVAVAAVVFMSALAGRARVASDLAIYQERASSWLAGTGFYLPHQVTGAPYTIQLGDATYPPPSLLLFVPFTILPAILWWLVPAVIAAAAITRIRPTGWALVALLFAFAWPRTWDLIVVGNPAMWAFAFLLAGHAWGWPMPFTALKLTLAPFGLVGIWRRRWWVGAAIGAIACLAFAPMWPDYVSALLNARSNGTEYGLDYIVADWPVAAALVAAGYRRSPWPRGST